MTISSTVNRKEYTGNGVTTDFSFPYPVLAAGDLKVYLNGVLQTITTHYNLSATPPQSSLDVQFVTAPPDTESVVILRDPAITQETDYITGGKMPAEQLETNLDRLTQIAQRLSDRMDRAFILSDTVVGVDVTLPTPSPSKLLGWNATGDGLTNFTELGGSVAVSSFMETVLDDASAIAALATLGAPDLDQDNVFTGNNEFTGILELIGSGALVLQGATDHATNKMTAAIADFTAARTLTIPDADVDLSGVRVSTLTQTGFNLLPRRFIQGCEASPDGTSTVPVAAGQLVMRNGADTDHKLINCAAISKTTSSWVDGSGNGGLSTGTIANNTWYWLYEIMRSDTGVVDVMVDPSATSPTLPTDYDYYRLIAPVRTDGSGNFTKYIQHKDYFEWGIDTTAVTTISATATLRAFDHLPDGMIVKGHFNVRLFTSGAPSAQVQARHWDPALGSTAINENDADIAISVTSGGVITAVPIECYCNTSQEIYNDAITGSPTYRATVRGFTFDRENQ